MRGFGLGQNVERGGVHLGFLQGLADGNPLGGEESVGHGPADDEHVDFVDQIAEQIQLGGHFGAADDGHDRALRVL